MPIENQLNNLYDRHSEKHGGIEVGELKQEVRSNLNKLREIFGKGDLRHLGQRYGELLNQIDDLLSQQRNNCDNILLLYNNLNQYLEEHRSKAANFYENDLPPIQFSNNNQISPSQFNPSSTLPSQNLTSISRPSYLVDSGNLKEKYNTCINLVNEGKEKVLALQKTYIDAFLERVKKSSQIV
ncbi:MAG: hypothetical protein OHK0017_10220 [Patescibacteria group bacterium]